MDEILKSIINDEIDEQSWKQWLNNENNAVDLQIGGQKILATMPVNNFIGQFLDSLHSSFDWLVKQLNNISVNRTQKHLYNTLKNENKVFNMVWSYIETFIVIIFLDFIKHQRS